MSMKTNTTYMALTAVAFAVFASATAHAASPTIEPTSNPQVTVSGNAPAGCALSGWELVSGPSGAFTDGTAAVFTYDSSDMTTNGVSNFSGSSGKIKVRAALVCNTTMTWTIGLQKGALADDSPPASLPAGFSDAWLYHLNAAPEDASHHPVLGFSTSYNSNGSPLPLGVIQSSLAAPAWGLLRSFSIDFTPKAVPSGSSKMIAGHYSEVITLQVQPAF
jgi:hypothetical protein